MAGPANREDRIDHLERLIMGLEQTIQSQCSELPYYKESDIVLVYVKKFIASCEENLAQSKKELDELKAQEAAAPKTSTTPPSP